MSASSEDNPVLAAIANNRRLAILRVLSEREMSVGELADILHLSQSALSQHLSRLRGAQVVTTRREGQTIYYQCDSGAVAALLEALDRFIVR